MRRHTRIIGGQLAMRDNARLAGLFSDLRWLLLVVLTGLVGLLTSGPVHPTGLPPARTGTAGSHASGTGSTAPIVPGYVLVRPRPGLPPAAFAKVLAAHGGTVIGQLNGLDVYVVSLPKTASPQAVAHALSAHPHIKFAEPDTLVPLQFVPNDTYYTSEWHLQTIGAPSAWDIATGSGITVAILDSGIDATHPDLASQVVPGWNFYDNNSNTADVYGHGTEVAGVVAALGNNSMGVAGAAFNARLMPIRVTDTSGYASVSALANGLTYAADHGARVANMSFAVQSSSTVVAAAQYFVNKGGVVMNSAGNYGALDSTTPSGALVSVSATDSADAVAGWSSYGPYVDVAAPGVSIWTTTMGGGYSAVSGTSFSSPLTAGVAALMMSANRALAPSQVVSLLESTAADLGTAGYDNYYGYGRVNAARAVAAAAAGAPSDTQAPSVAISAPTGGSVSGIAAVNVTASDNIGVTHVDLLVNGALLASDTTAPYGFSWDSSSLVGTSGTLIARAYDAAGNVGTSQAVTVSVSSSVPSVTLDTSPPTVKFMSPANGSKVSGNVTIAVSASDNVKIGSITLSIDGATVATSNASSVNYRWNTRKVASGSHTVTAVARDVSGNQASTSISLSK